jgi:hypothetical protein
MQDELDESDSEVATGSKKLYKGNTRISLLE